MLQSLLQQLHWTVWRRIRLQHAIPGFRASPFSYSNKSCSFEEFAYVGRNVRLTDVSLGRFSYIVSGTARSCTIGRFCAIGQEVKLGGLASHPRHISTHPSFYSPAPPVGKSFRVLAGYQDFRHVNIGHDVWIGDRAIVLDGVTLQTGAIVGAGAIVTRDVGPYEIVAGSPARCIRKRVPEQYIAGLLESRWWDWSLDDIGLCAKYIATDDYQHFLREAAKIKL